MKTALILVAAALAASSAETPEQLFSTALRHFSDERYAESEKLLRVVVQQRPKWFDARFVLGAVLVSLGRSADAVRQLEQAHRLSPGHLDCVKLLAAEYLVLERSADALVLLRPLVRGSPDEEVFLLAIEALYADNRSEEALGVSTRGLSKFPRSARMLAWRGYALRERGELSEARKSLEAALGIDPDDPAARGLLGDVALRQGRYPEALALFEQVLRQAPADEEAVIGKSRTLVAMGKTGEAVDVVQAAVQAAPKAARLRLELSQLFAKLGDRENAARQAAEFRSLRRSSSEQTIPAGLRKPPSGAR